MKRVCYIFKDRWKPFLIFGYELEKNSLFISNLQDILRSEKVEISQKKTVSRSKTGEMSNRNFPIGRMSEVLKDCEKLCTGLSYIIKRWSFMQ